MSALRVFDGDILCAGTGDFQAGFLQGNEDILPRVDFLLFHKGQHIGVNSLFGFVAFILFDGLSPAQKTGLEQAGMLRRIHASVSRIIRSGPALADIVQIAEHIEMLLPAGRAGIERLAAGKLHTRNDEMQLVVSGMAVPHPEDIALIRIQSGKGHSLKIIHDALFLLWGDDVGGMPRQDPGGETPCVVQRINQVAGHIHIAAQNFRRIAVTARIVGVDEILRGCKTSSSSVGEDLHQHDMPPSWGGGAVSRASRSRLMSAASTSTVSALLLWMLAHRAI